MKKGCRSTAGDRILASINEASQWAEAKPVPVRVTEVAAPVVHVRSTGKRLGLSQAAFAARFGFQTATVRNWEQGRTRPDGPARVLLAVPERHPEAVEDALRQPS